MKKNYILLILFMFTLSSCSVDDTQVSVFIYDENDPYVYNFAQQITNKSNDSYNIYYSKNSQVIQNQDIITYVEEDSNLMIINPVDRLSSYVIIEKLKTEDIPVIFFNREPLKKDLDLWDEAYYIGAPAEQPGIYQADMIMELFGNNPNNLNEFEVVISNNDAMAIGAIENLIKNNYFLDDNEDGILDKNDESWMPVIGVDGLSQAVDYIESGHMYGTIINDTDAMVDAMIDLANAILYDLDKTDLMYPLVDDTYIWINYEKYTN